MCRGRVPSSIIQKWRENLKNSEYYRTLAHHNTDFPIITKQQFMANFNQINTANIDKQDAYTLALKSEETRDYSPSIRGYSIGLSTGTSGSRGLFITSPREREMWVGIVLERVIGLTLKKRKIAFFLRANNNLYESVNSSLLQFHYYDIQTPISEHIDSLEKLNPQILVAQPSVLIELAKLYTHTQTKPNFTKIISVAEVLEEDQASYIRSVFNCAVDQVYQCTEGFLAYTCKAGNMHLNEDFLRVEKKYIDKENKRFHPIITDYLRFSQPVVRYELNDILHEGPPCSCGIKSTVVSKIEGRSDDVFSFISNGQTIVIYPDFVRRAVVASTENLVNYRVSQLSNTSISFDIQISKNADKKTEKQHVQNGLKQLLARYNLSHVQITYLAYHHPKSSKFKRISNDYKA